MTMANRNQDKSKTKAALAAREGRVNATPAEMIDVRLLSSVYATLQAMGPKILAYDEKSGWRVTDRSRVRRAFSALGGGAWADLQMKHLDEIIEEANGLDPAELVRFVI